MNKDKPAITSTPEHHLSIDQMYQYLDNQLPVADRHQVEQHLLDCDLCTDALAGFSLTTKETTERQLFQINYQLKNRASRRKPNTMLLNLKNWGITSMILFIIILAALLVWYQVKQSQDAKKTKTRVPTTQLIPAPPLSLVNKLNTDSNQFFRVQSAKVKYKGLKNLKYKYCKREALALLG